MNSIYILMFVVPVAFGFGYAAFATWLKYKQNLAMLEVLRLYAERGELPPSQVLEALNAGTSLTVPGGNAPPQTYAAPSARPVQGAAHYWSLVGMFGVFTGGFGYVSWLAQGKAFPFLIVTFTMGAVMVWSLIMALVSSGRK